jgi:hypothetical protein
MNYRLLLWKYIRHVGECEGITYLGENHLDKSFATNPTIFSDDELAALLELDKLEKPPR